MENQYLQFEAANRENGSKIPQRRILLDRDRGSGEQEGCRAEESEEVQEYREIQRA